ncbi:MAG: hypothetical protein ACLQSR_07335 [Limisphaerales bacterium]
MVEKWKYLDEHLRLRLADLPWRLFEEFFLHFLRSGITLTINRHGQAVTKRIISADLYAAGSGRDQKGIDLRAEVEGGEIWVFQCKHHDNWTPQQTRDAIKAAADYPAQHYFLAVACDPHERVQDEMDKHPNWTFWNLSTICAEFKREVPVTKQAQVLSSFLLPQELKRFIPYTTESLLPPEKYFEQFVGNHRLLRHDWKLVGREREMQALRNFLGGTDIVQIVSARGGEGKSRLIWELCITLPKEIPDAEILILNPHRSDEDFQFAFQGDPSIRVIVIDDAHRAEQVPLQLLSLVAQETRDRKSKIILATRPQGAEALSHKLYETGLLEKRAPLICVSPLKKSQTKALATEVLGTNLEDHANDLVKLTADSPFLTVVAGGLLREGRLKWGGWARDNDFRQDVFREFEHKNLESVPEPDRHVSKSLLRLLALLAPVSIGPDFSERVAKCLGRPIVEIENHLIRLRQTELVAGGEDGLRIVPDLFADFLVYEGCYEPTQKTPGFVQQILREFSDRSSALLRNLSEATWVARANQIPDGDLLRPLMEQEHARFKSAGFWERAQILQHWSDFSVYLPKESLDLGRLAVSLKTVGDGSEQDASAMRLPRFTGSWDDVCDQLSTLLKPIALYHQEYRRDALDYLWQLGMAKKWGHNNQNHPWAAIAEVIKFNPQKPNYITLDALDWLESCLQSPRALKILESRTPVLRLLLGPCFNRVVGWTWWEGRTCHFCKGSVSIEDTQPIRDKAFGILAWVIEHGTWLAALDALSALAGAIQRILLPEFQKEEEIPKLAEKWRSERLKALALFEKIIAKHNHFAVLYEIRQTLKRDLAYEKDHEFTKQARKVLNSLPNDLTLKTAVALMSNATYEFEEEIRPPFTQEQHQKIEARWNEQVRQIAAELAANFPTPSLLHEFIRNMADDLVLAGNRPTPATLFLGLAEAAHDLALYLALKIITLGTETNLSQMWPALFEKNSAANEEKQIEFFQIAIKTSIPGVQSAVIRALAWKARQNQPLCEVLIKLLMDIAKEATEQEAMNLLDLVEWCSDANMVVAVHILQNLPVKRHAPRMILKVLEALVPYQERKSLLPPEVIHSVVMQLVDVSDLQLHEAPQWNSLIKQYPRLIFNLLTARLDHAAKKDTPADYLPVPFGFEGRLNLPGLAKEPDFPEICQRLWKRILKLNDPQHLFWIPLFQGVVIGDAAFWLDRMGHEIATATSEEMLLLLAALLKFEGSLIIFRFPDLTRAFLARAKSLGGQVLYEKVRTSLYTGCGPQTRSYSSGVLDKDLDYVEAEAVKAAENHAKDEVLGPFYRWIVEIEQTNRLVHKSHAETAMAAWD